MTGGHDGKFDVPALTGLRALAAWWVVVYHVRILFVGTAPELIPFFAKGYLAVDMFFVLSGFVIYLNYAGRLTATLSSLSDFMVRRIARIYPLHFVLLMAALAYALAVLAAGKPLPDRYAPDLFVLNLFLVHNWGFTDVLGWNIPSWSISTELFAYMLFPLVPLVLRWERWSALALGVAIAGLIAGLHFAFAREGLTLLGQQVAQMGLLRCVTQFMIGTILCALFLRARTLKSRPWLSILLLVLAGGLAAGVAGYGFAETLTLPWLWVALILGISLWPAGWLNPLAARGLVYLGDISYSTYLLHYLAFVFFKLVFVDDLRAVPGWVGPAFLLAVLCMSIALYHGVERPAQRWILNGWKRRRGNGAATGPSLAGVTEPRS